MSHIFYLFVILFSILRSCETIVPEHEGSTWKENFSFSIIDGSDRGNVLFSAEGFFLKDVHNKLLAYEEELTATFESTQLTKKNRNIVFAGLSFFAKGENNTSQHAFFPFRHEDGSLIAFLSGTSEHDLKVPLPIAGSITTLTTKDPNTGCTHFVERSKNSLRSPYRTKLRTALERHRERFEVNKAPLDKNPDMYSHSEMAMCTYLSKHIEKILDDSLPKLPFGASSLQGVTLNFHSTNTVCKMCAFSCAREFEMSNGIAAKIEKWSARKKLSPFIFCTATARIDHASSYASRIINIEEEKSPIVINLAKPFPTIYQKFLGEVSDKEEQTSQEGKLRRSSSVSLVRRTPAHKYNTRHKKCYREIKLQRLEEMLNDYLTELDKATSIKLKEKILERIEGVNKRIKAFQQEMEQHREAPPILAASSTSPDLGAITPLTPFSQMSPFSVEESSSIDASISSDMVSPLLDLDSDTSDSETPTFFMQHSGSKRSYNEELPSQGKRRTVRPAPPSPRPPLSPLSLTTENSQVAPATSLVDGEKTPERNVETTQRKLLF